MVVQVEGSLSNISRKRLECGYKISDELADVLIVTIEVVPAHRSAAGHKFLSPNGRKSSLSASGRSNDDCQPLILALKHALAQISAALREADDPWGRQLSLDDLKKCFHLVLLEYFQSVNFFYF